MTDVDAKVNMSLDEIIKLEKKKKSGVFSVKGGVEKARGANTRARGGGRQARQTSNKQNIAGFNKTQAWQRFSNKLRGGFFKKRYNKRGGGLNRSRSNLTLNRNFKTNTRGGFEANHRFAGNKFGLIRSGSRSNLSLGQGRFLSVRSSIKKTNSMPNLRDPTSVHNRLGYQSPAQIAYRNRVKRAKQLLLQRQNQRMNLQNDFRVGDALKSLTSLHQRALERPQQIITSQRRVSTGGLRSDQIVRAQRRAKYENKLMRLNSAQMNAISNVNFTCTLGPEFSPEIRQRSLSLSQRKNDEMMCNLQRLPRGRSAFRLNMQNLNMFGRNQQFSQQRRSRPRSRSRNRGIPAVDPTLNLDDRSFSEVMYSLSGNLGVTGRTLNDRFSF
ncbi:uncharacterized protein LOC117168111 [Belonocnema kinseyi]|uniref:uncharacterized protein LOC117168111 n=1 Tax=Belonocnema kinseyi TaxID=2817044 RepID=UPI00143D69F0|nr:uncharacterized protein LOC117168111 [Belonocnema kinseyi]